MGVLLRGSFAFAAVLTVNPAQTYQHITGWEAVAWAGEPGDPAFALIKDELFERTVNDVGINRLRLEIRSGVEYDNDNWTDYQNGVIDYSTWRSRRYATVNDNDDPMVIDPNGFHFSEMDAAVEYIVLPIKQRLEARGETLFLNVNYVAFTGQITSGQYLHDNPAEYAEFVLAAYQHIQSKYGLVPDAWEVLLEPDNVSQWDGTLLGQAIVAAANRLSAAGFTPVFIAPSNTNMGRAITYFDNLVQVPGAVDYLKELSYHRYGGVSLANLQTIASRAVQYGIETSMLEWWSNSNGYHVLHEDLKVGLNSAWQQGVIAGPGNPDSGMSLFKVDTGDPAHPVLYINNKTKFFRQYYKFVRPGAHRVEVSSNDGNFDPLAFVNSDGRYVVVIKANTAGGILVEGLATGTYGIKYTTSGQYDIDLPTQQVTSGVPLQTSIPAAGVMTIHQILCPEGDLNLDCRVNLFDFVIGAAAWPDQFDFSALSTMIEHWLVCRAFPCK
jgi:hypothetical protein